MEQITKETRNLYDHVTFQAIVVGCILENHLRACSIEQIYEMEKQIEIELKHPVHLSYLTHQNLVSPNPIIEFYQNQFSLNPELQNDPIRAREILNSILNCDGKIVRRIVSKKAQAEQNFITLQQLEHIGCLSEQEQFEQLYPDYSLVYDERRMSKLELRDTIPTEEYLYLNAVEEFKNSQQKVLTKQDIQKRAQG